MVEEYSSGESHEAHAFSRRGLLRGGAALLVGTLLPRQPGARNRGATPLTAGAKRFYIAPDDHTDYFWTAGEDDYRQAFLNMIDYYLDLADTTEANPTEHQSRWNCDGSFWMWTYEKNRPAADFQRLVDRIRSGHISVPLNALCVCLGGAPAEAVLRGMYYPGQIERQYDLRFPLAYTIENQTQPYGLVSLWTGSGAKYSWKGVCGCATQLPAASFRDREHEIYWWVGPDGSRMLMKWNSMLGNDPNVSYANQSIGGYAEARNPFTIVDYLDTDPEFLARYPYQVVGAFGAGWDDFQTLTQDFVTAAIAKTNTSRSVIVSNEKDFFEDFEAIYGADLPSLSCSFGNEWDLYCASMAEVSARVKRAVEKLRSAEALATLVTLQDDSFMDGREEARNQAWMDLGLYWEHNWTADTSPQLRAARRDWQRRIAGEIEGYVDALHADAANALGGLIQRSGSNLRFYAFNPLSWERTDVADFPYSGPTPVHVIDLDTGQEMPSQLVDIGGEQYLRVLAQNVPSVGYRVFEVRVGAGQGFPDGPSANATTGIIQNELYQITAAPRGAITSLLDRTRSNRQFARDLAGYYINDLGPGSGTLTVENAGLVSVTLKATASVPLAHTTRITLFRNDINRIDIRNEITSNFGDVYTWRYGFNLDTPDVWHEEVGAIIRAKLLAHGGHYSPRSARYDWLTLNHFADVNGSGGVGVTLSNADCYYMKLGASTPTLLDTSMPQISPLAGGQVDGPQLGIPDQGGDAFFLQRFALKTHGAYDPVQAMRFSLEHQNPLITGQVTGGSAYPETSYSFLAISDPNVLLWALKPADDGIDQGLIARLWNLSPEPVNCSLALASGPMIEATRTTHIETPIEPAPLDGGTLPASFNAHELKTWSILPSNTGWPTGWPELAMPTGVSASDGTSPYQIHVTWNAVPGATTHEVWRNTSADLGSAEPIASVVGATTFGDTSAIPEQLYYYWLKARNAYATSDFSVPDTGWRRLPLPGDFFVYLPLIRE